MKATALLAGLAVSLVIATPALAEVPKFTATCLTGIDVKSNGKGKVRINGEKVTATAFSSTAWEARGKTVSINIAQDGSKLIVTYTGIGGKSGNGICQVTSSTTGTGARFNDVPKKDQKACLAAVSKKTGNGAVVVMAGSTSEAGNTVMVGAGPHKAKWRCLVKDGKVTDAVSLTGEGAL